MNRTIKTLVVAAIGATAFAAAPAMAKCTAKITFINQKSNQVAVGNFHIQKQGKKRWVYNNSREANLQPGETKTLSIGTLRKKSTRFAVRTLVSQFAKDGKNFRVYTGHHTCSEGHGTIVIK